MEGVPPVRAMVMDWPDDTETRLIDDQWMLGDALMIAPVMPDNSFAQAETLEIAPQEQWTIGEAKLKKGANCTSFTLNGDFDNAGLRGIQIPFNLNAGISYTIEFSYRSNCHNIGTRLWSMEGTPQDVAALKNDELLADDAEWSKFKKEFQIQRPGKHMLFLGKPWREQTKNGKIEIRNLRVISKLKGSPEQCNSRFVYLPKGDWFDFWTGKKLIGGQWITTRDADGNIPVFVRAEHILPLAEPVQYVDRQTIFNITCHAYGRNCLPILLYEDDGETFDFDKGDYNTLELICASGEGKTVKKGEWKGTRYTIRKWETIE